MRITKFLATSFLFLSPVLAAAYPVTQIEIKGNQRVDSNSVRSYLAVKEGEEFSAAKLNKSVKDLFKTGLYSDVNISENDGQVLVDVVENPIISQVAFEGNEAIEDDKFVPEVTLKSRSIYTKAAVQDDVQRIANIYRRAGRYNAKVEPKVILKDQNRVDLVFEITEGEVTRIKKINFIGNLAFSDKNLQSVVRSAEEAWYNILSSDDSYDPDRIEYDKELLRRFYAQNGFADFQVESAIAEQTQKEDGFILTFSINEGIKYHFGEVNVFSNLEDIKFDNKDEEVVKARKSELFDETRVEKTVENLIDLAGQKGYAFVDIDPQLNKRKDEKVIDIDFVVNEGPKVYVDKIKIHGNSRTLDSVVRREFRIAEGDPYNSALLARSKQRVENLDFFNKVDIKRLQGTGPDKVDIDVAVEEKSTGELNFGAGFSSTDGVLGDVSVSERNLLGRGQFLRLNVSASQRRQQGQVSFTEPYFMDENLAAGFDIYKTVTDEQDSSSYDSKALGLNLRAGYEINEHLRHNVKYSISDDQITNVDPTASLYIREQEGQRLSSIVGHALTYDYLDNRRLPKDGYLLKFNQEIAGLGGDVKFLRHSINGGYYIPLTEEKEWYVTLAGEGGNVSGFGGEDVPINERYFLGGNSFRGFARAGLGPRDSSTGDALGGANYYKLTTELAFPLSVNDDFGLTGAFFADGGSLWGAESSGANIVDNADPRLTVGFGVGWASPFGPLRVDFGFPVVKDEVDETENFQLNFGTNF